MAHVFCATDESGQTVWINAAHIISFQVSVGGTKTRLWFGGQDSLIVEEPPDVIAARINAHGGEHVNTQETSLD
jgi:hypothetical protein